MLTIGCLDVAIEHQAAIALLTGASLHGSAFALLRSVAEAFVRGVWLQACATEEQLADFKLGKFHKHFADLINEYEAEIGTPSGVMSQFKASAWKALNGFTHTGFHQVSRRHSPGRLGGNYSEEEISDALGVAGALGLIAAGHLMAMSVQQGSMQPYFDKLDEYAKPLLA
ncbi:DUF6988 family protein [Hydrogenophaga sp. T2]|uniref:DUF6988 family protein n=1 Tax=Hydrogenophaga sp. T2 TaxID=3132823 RepID=UPI003CF6CC13